VVHREIYTKEEVARLIEAHISDVCDREELFLSLLTAPENQYLPRGADVATIVSLIRDQESQKGEG
jgi:hypothetical protein